MRPLLFVGSSSEGLDVAYAAQENLQDLAEVVVWKQGIFGISEFTLKALLDTLDESQFGLFIFTPDDIINIRGKESRVTRDNVVFELGLFIGRLGIKRTFLMLPDNALDLHLPTDLMGITAATFRPPDRPHYWQGALAPACHRIEREIKEVLQESEQHSHATDLGANLPLFLSQHEWRHLLNLSRGNTKSYISRGSLRAELRHLRGLGLVRNRPERHISDMSTGMELNLADYVELTKLGTDSIARG